MRNKQGYGIAQNSTTKAFFTSSSAYDRPSWLSANEATIYPTAELANLALTKLLKHGAYSARLVEAGSMQFEFPDEGPNKDQPPITQTTDDASDDEMVAGQLSDDDTDELNQDGDEIEMGDDFDEDQDDEPQQDQEPDHIGQFGDDHNIGQEYHDEDYGQENPSYDLGQRDDVDREEDNEQSFLSPIEKQMMAGKRTRYPTGQGPMKESATMPKKPLADGTPADNKNTVLNGKKVPVIKFNQPACCPTDANFAQDIEPMENAIKVPKNVMRAVNASIETFDRAADFNNGRDDALASFSCTVASALRDIKAYLDLGTQEGLKQAQIKITTYMNPITTKLPPELFDYLSKAGRQPMSLKTMFYDVWDNKKKD
jgi:hypothetical protein